MSNVKKDLDKQNKLQFPNFQSMYQLVNVQAFKPILQQTKQTLNSQLAFMQNNKLYKVQPRL